MCRKSGVKPPHSKLGHYPHVRWFDIGSKR